MHTDRRVTVLRPFEKWDLRFVHTGYVVLRCSAAQPGDARTTTLRIRCERTFNRLLSPVHTSDNVEATLSNATMSNVASTLLPFWATMSNFKATFDFVAKNGNNVERVLR